MLVVTIIFLFILIIISFLVYSFKLDKSIDEKSVDKTSGSLSPLIQIPDNEIEPLNIEKIRAEIIGKKGNTFSTYPDENPESKNKKRKLKDIPDLTERIHKARQRCMPLKPFDTKELKPSDFIINRQASLKETGRKLSPSSRSVIQEKIDYIKVSDLKNLSFQDLILDPRSINQNLKYLEDTIKIARYKYKKGEELKDKLEKILSAECEKTSKSEGEILLKRSNEAGGYIKEELEIKDFICEDLQDLLDWVKKLEANNSLELKILSKGLFNLEKDMILILDIITKLERQTSEIQTLKEKLLEKWEDLYSEKPYIFISSC